MKTEKKESMMVALYLNRSDKRLRGDGRWTVVCRTTNQWAALFGNELHEAMKEGEAKPSAH